MRKRNITPETRQQIANMLQAGTKPTLIATQLKISNSTVWRTQTELRKFNPAQPAVMPVTQPTGLTRGQRGAITKQQNKMEAARIAASKVFKTFHVDGNEYKIPAKLNYRFSMDEAGNSTLDFI